MSTPSDRRTFDEWLDDHGIQLSTKQREAAYAVLDGMRVLGGGRGAGKTFVLATVDRFIDEVVRG